ncbi:MAG: T9SS type A sorting domain-containing protein [Bacteroidota bacterium]|nr:T9SS type A sorting domain-containing protein [Bacteroidota bacterium]MDP3145970.1 T9SS type A sorting domain-containing protein [Bacteroidota bacterium]MDP3558605.1 T9SS type A sorting domain-containing protein [Bacteroidota bacterium]
MNSFKFQYILVFVLCSSVLFCQNINTPIIIQDDGTVFNSDALINPINQNQAKVMGCASAANLVTFYATNNAQRGIMFDIQAINAITVLCFEMNLNVGTTNMEIYTKTGTHVGFQNNAAAWTLVGNAANVTSAGVNLPTNIPIPLAVGIGAGLVQAFYITRTTAFGPTGAYTNGTGVGNTLAFNADLILKEGTGKDYPFGASFAPRSFNGRVFYDMGALPIELLDFSAYYEKDLVKLKWSTATERNNNYFSIERSKDAINFEEIYRVQGAGNSSSLLNYENSDSSPLPGISYYRLKQIDFSGEFQYSPIKAVNELNNTHRILVSPSPANDNLTVKISNLQTDYCFMNIYNMNGDLVFSKDYLLNEGINKIDINVSTFNKGIYQLNLLNGSEIQNIKFIKE